MTLVNESAEQTLNRAIALKESGYEGDAIKLYHSLIKHHPQWSTPYYNLALIYKYQGNWGLCYDFNKMATKLEKDSEPAWWNLGIAATALKKWREAREAWNYFGLGLDVNRHEPRLNIGRSPIRLNPEGNAEVVWADRIDPARAMILNIPLPESGHRYKDLVLNDGAPVGKRISDGVEYAVFNELELISPSNYKTYSIEIFTETQEDIKVLNNLCTDAGVGFEDWGTLRILCKQCSEGTPHEHHDNEYKCNNENSRKIALSSIKKSTLSKILENWQVITLCEHGELDLEFE